MNATALGVWPRGSRHSFMSHARLLMLGRPVLVLTFFFHLLFTYHTIYVAPSCRVLGLFHTPFFVSFYRFTSLHVPSDDITEAVRLACSSSRPTAASSKAPNYQRRGAATPPLSDRALRAPSLTRHLFEENLHPQTCCLCGVVWEAELDLVWLHPENRAVGRFPLILPQRAGEMSRA